MMLVDDPETRASVEALFHLRSPSVAPHTATALSHSGLGGFFIS
jgi:hypothetical protein